MRFWDVVVDHKPVSPEKKPFSIYNEKYCLDTYGDGETFAQVSSLFKTHAVITPDGDRPRADTDDSRLPQTTLSRLYLGLSLLGNLRCYKAGYYSFSVLLSKSSMLNNPCAASSNISACRLVSRLVSFIGCALLVYAIRKHVPVFFRHCVKHCACQVAKLVQRGGGSSQLDDTV